MLTPVLMCIPYIMGILRHTYIIQQSVLAKSEEMLSVILSVCQ